MIKLKAVEKEEKKLLYNLLQKYLYEMTEFYDIEADAEGNYIYEYFEDYFGDTTRKALFILWDEKVVGFVLVNKHSAIGGDPDYAIAEFTILPKYRKCCIAKRAVQLLFEKYPGSWEVKYHVLNIPAMRLWRSVAAPFDPVLYTGLEDEQVLVFDTSKGIVGGSDEK